MRILYLLFVCLIGSVSLGFGQNREVILLDFEYQQIEGIYRNADPSCKGLKPESKGQPTTFESQAIQTNLQDVAPFLSVALKWQASGITHHHDDIELQIRTSEDAQNWEEWQSIHTDGHAPVKKDTYFGELMYFDENTKFIQSRITLKNTSVIFKKLEIHLYNPGKTPPVKTGQKQNHSKSDLSQSSCPCDQPDYLSRDKWCPAGNCPPGSNPVSTSPTHLIVHHSAGSNTSSDWAAVVRSIWNYHANVNGWDDIGYNWVIDGNGVVYEGRGDGIRGAHFCGNNSGTQGNCLLGNFTDTQPSSAARDKVVELLAWQACQYEIDPVASAYHSASGFSFNGVAGHRQGCSTACPGDSFYPQMGSVRTEVEDYIDGCNEPLSYEDIYITNTSVSSTNIGCGINITMSCIQNYSGSQTDANLPAFDLYYYLSTDATLSSSDILLTTDNSGLGIDDPSNTEVATAMIPADTAPGTYYILFVADAENELTESNENNNIESIQIEVYCAVPEDVFLTNVSVSSTNLNCGDEITMSCRHNYSGGQTNDVLPSIDVDYYLSTNTIFDNSDILLGVDASSIGSDDAFDDESTTGVIPADTAPGTYYVLFVADADNEVNEEDEDNNIEYVQIQVSCAPTMYTIIVTANPFNGGTAGGGGTYTSGNNATVTANPNSGWTFTNWTENGTVTSNNPSYSFTVASNRNLVANFSPPPPPSCREADSLALVAFYQSTNGANWTTTWTLTQPVSTWHGITLNADACVAEINLSQNNLVGIIPPEIEDLSALTRLNLHTNNLSGSIPATLGNLSELRQLWLFNNQLSGELPPEIGDLSNLTQFGAGANQLTGTIPASYGNLSNLGLFTIPQNNLSGCFADNLLNICDAASNSNINSGNNFDALWSDFCANGAGNCSTPLATCRYLDSLVLVKLYQSTNGANWTNTWNLSTPMQTWNGITLNADGCVTHINLNSNNLAGTIPTEIGELAALTTLNMHTNNLSGGIPATIGDLNELSQIWLFRNQLSGELPPEIGNLSNLALFGAGVNQFTGTIPASYGNLSNLAFFTIPQNNLSGCFDDNLLNICDAADNLNINIGNNFDALWNDFCANGTGSCTPPPPSANCGMDSLILVDLYQATNGPNWAVTWNLNQPIHTWHGVMLNTDGCLEELNLPNNNLVGTLPTTVGGLSALVRLNLHTNQLSGSIPASIGNITTLEQLWLFSNQMTGTLPTSIGNLSNLSHFGIGNNQFTGSIPASYGNLSSLGFLAIKSNNLSGCYDVNLANICHAGTDARVSAGNNFAALWSSFCTSASGCCNCRLDMSGNDVGGDSFDENSITLYPNPVKNTLYIAGLDDQQIQQLTLFDINGKMMRAFEFPVNSIDVSGVPRGIYVVKIVVNDSILHRKIVVE